MPQTVPNRPTNGAVALIGNSVLHSALMADHARGAKKASLPVFLTNGGRTMTATVSERGDTTVFSIAGMDVHILWDINGGPREMMIPAQNLRVVRTSRRAFSRASSSATLRLTVGSGTPSLRLAAVKLPASTTLSMIGRMR